MTLTPQHSKRFIPTTALTKPCQHCGAEIRGMPSELARRKFCSKDCVGASRKGKRKKEWVELPCRQCGKVFEVTQAWVRNGRRKYCSRTCLGKATVAGARLGKYHSVKTREQIGKSNKGKLEKAQSPKWKEGRYFNTQGYVHVMIETLPDPMRTLVEAMASGKSRYVLEHRAVMAVKLGRPLTKKEIVHHKDGNKGNNNPANLFVVERGLHSLEHREMERRYLAALDRIQELETELAILRSQNT